MCSSARNNQQSADRLQQTEILISSYYVMPSCNGPNSIILQNLIFRVRDDVRRAINEMKSDVGSQGGESEVDGCIGYAVDSSWGTAAIAGSYPGFVLSWLEVQENGKFG